MKSGVVVGVTIGIFSNNPMTNNITDSNSSIISARLKSDLFSEDGRVRPIHWFQIIFHRGNVTCLYLLFSSNLPIYYQFILTTTVLIQLTIGRSLNRSWAQFLSTYSYLLPSLRSSNLTNISSAIFFTPFHCFLIHLHSSVTIRFQATQFFPSFF